LGRLVRNFLREAAGPSLKESVVKGIVKFYNEAKGFGFIGVEGGEDVFVHFNAIQANGLRTLPEGAVVEFETVRGKKGLQADNVRLSG
jgi:CspA family cold shock protein